MAPKPDLTLESKQVKYAISSRAEMAYEGLRDRIISGEFPPGTPLQEPQLCEQLNVSRSPLRQSLTRLTSEGLVEQIHGVGWFVRKLSPLECIQTMELRRTCEASAAALAAEKILPDEIPALLDLGKDVEAVCERGVFEEIQQAELRFHRHVLALSKNPEMIRMFENILTVSLTLTLEGEVSSVPPESADHLAVAKAIAGGDPSVAFDSVWQHFVRPLAKWRAAEE